MTNHERRDLEGLPLNVAASAARTVIGKICNDLSLDNLVEIAIPAKCAL